MPWKESRTSDDRLKFIAQVLSGDSAMTDLCRCFGVSPAWLGFLGSAVQCLTSFR